MLKKAATAPFALEGLDTQAAAKVATAVIRLELGNASNVKWIGGGLGEYRIDWGAGIGST